MVIQGKWYYSNREEDLIPRKMRGDLARFGRIPGFVIRSRDALSPTEMNKNLSFARFCIDRFANVPVMPVPTGFEGEMQKKVEEAAKIFSFRK